MKIYVAITLWLAFHVRIPMERRKKKRKYRSGSFHLAIFLQANSSNYLKLLNYPRFTRIASKFFRNDFYPECNIRWRSVRSLRVRGQEITFPIITQRAVWSSCVVGSLLFQADSFFRSRGNVRRGASAVTWLGLTKADFLFGLSRDPSSPAIGRR